MGKLVNKAYSLRDFLFDCKSNKNKVFISKQAKQDARSLPIFSNIPQAKLQVGILDFLAEHEESDFTYINTKPYRNHKDKPLLDAYNLSLRWYELYISFYVEKIAGGWVIKSFHSDNSHSGSGDTISIADLLQR